MRFSLATLLLLVLFSASLMAVWARREPWITYSSAFNIEDLKRTYQLDQKARHMSPDGTRIVGPTSQEYMSVKFEQFLVIWDSKTQNPSISNSLARFEHLWSTEEEGFIDDDTVVAATDSVKTPTVISLQFRIFKRRFPEWWWGHFYRPEVWASIVFGVALLAGAIRARRQKVTGT